MTVYDFLIMITEGDDVVYTLFDCKTEDVVFMATDEAENTCEFSRDDILFSNYADCEIYGMDVWLDKGRIHMEFNIEVEEE